jgi:hypothetical protein
MTPTPKRPLKIGDRLAFDMKKPCATCPFRKDIPLDGAPDWATDVLLGFRRGNLSHTCHKSDPKADGYVGGKRKQHCIGMLGMMKNMGNICISPDAGHALVTGELDWATVPTSNCWQSLKEMMFAYLKKFKEEGLVSDDMSQVLESKPRKEGVK